MAVASIFFMTLLLGIAGEQKIWHIPHEGTNFTVAVTAWYLIGNNAKKIPLRYHFYLENFKAFKTQKLMFTNEPDVFKGFDYIHIIPDTIEQMAKRTGYSVERWRKQYDLDPENFRHSLELYYIWIGRVFLLAEAMKIYPEAQWFFLGGLRGSSKRAPF